MKITYIVIAILVLVATVLAVRNFGQKQIPAISQEVKRQNEQTVDFRDSKISPSATIDSQSLVSSEGSTTLTGTASNTNQVEVGVIGCGAKCFNYGRSVPVINGKWSYTFNATDFKHYSVQVGVYNTAYELHFQELAKGTLVIK